jgi:hypothetical protein
MGEYLNLQNFISLSLSPSLSVTRAEVKFSGLALKGERNEASTNTNRGATTGTVLG